MKYLMMIYADEAQVAQAAPEQIGEMVAAYTGLERPGVGTIKHWPEWKFELWDRKTT